MLQMSSEQGTMANEQTSFGDSPSVDKQKGKREVTDMISDVLSQYSNESVSNKKQKTDKVDVVRSTSPADEEKSVSTADKATKVSEVDDNDSEIRDESESKKSKDASSVEDLTIDIEKAQYTFPERLMELLTNGTVKKAMWWLPGGEAFALVPNTFYDIVLAKYFQGTKFESFTRKLNRWGFKRLSGQGVPKGTIAYYHKMFKRGKPDLMKKMRSGKSSQNNEAETGYGRGLLENSFVPTSMDRSMAHLPPYLAARLQQADPASALLAQRAGLMAPGMTQEDLLKLQLLQQQQHAARQLLGQDPSAVAQFGMVPGSQAAELVMARRQAELRAMEEIRAAQIQEAAMAQAQLQARLLQQQQQQAQANGGAPSSAGLGTTSTARPTDEQLRMLLLRRQLGHSGGSW